MSQALPRIYVDDLPVNDAGALVRVLTISNPAKKNALTESMLSSLSHAVRMMGAAASAGRDVRALILQGDETGGGLSSGFSIDAIDEATIQSGLDPIRDAADALQACRIPTIATLDVRAFGGAFELAMACTWRIASPRAQLCMPPARLGLSYELDGLARFAPHATLGSLSRLFLLAEVITGTEAHRMGLVDFLDENPREKSFQVAGQVAKMAPLAVRSMLTSLKAMKMGQSIDDAEAMHLQSLRQETLNSDDLREGVRAFLERRMPVFRGK